jgi:hypothetical protein
VVIVEAWLPIVQALVSRGVVLPELIVFTLGYADLPLASGEQVYGRLPRALETVAKYFGRPLASVQREVFAQVPNVEAAANLIQRLKSLKPQLKDLPGVSQPGELYLPEPMGLISDLRRFAQLNGFRFPAPAAAHPEWMVLMHSLREHGIHDAGQLVWVARTTRLKLKSGAFVAPLDESTGPSTVAKVFELDPLGLRIALSRHHPNPQKVAQIRASLAQLGGVDSVEEVQPEAPLPK